MDKTLTEVLFRFPRPDTSDPNNDGRYIGEHGDFARLPWKTILGALKNPDPEVRGRAKSEILTTNQLIYIKSESINLRPIFHAAQVPIIPLLIGEFPMPDVEALSEVFTLTHQIERLGGVSSSITSTPNPWGQTRESLDRLNLIVHGRPQLQQFVILRRDLPLFCRALDGADSGYYHFGECTRHTITVHGPFDDILTEDIPIMHPTKLLQPYLEKLRGFENFTIQGRITPELARVIETRVRVQIETPQLGAVLRDTKSQMSQADEYLSLDRPMKAAHTYARASQGLVWLYNKGILPRESSRSQPSKLAELYFLLNLRQATAWLAVMQKRYEASKGANQISPNDGRVSFGKRAEGYINPERYSSLVDLVYETVTRFTPPPLRHKLTPHQNAIQLYQAAKADRLCDRLSFFTWTHIHDALRKAPDDDEIRHEAELINGRMMPWQERWKPE